jgi:hypothetical protein
MKKITNKILAVVFGIAFLAVSCEKSSDNPSGSSPVVTDKGTPYGSVTSVEVGQSGGTVYSPDGKLKLIIPQGALSSSTTISVQSISNEAPLGAGNAYRLSPEGTVFEKPVQMIFSYDQQLTDDIPADFFWIVTQAADGSWNALMKSTVDKNARTVSVEAKHFSDWALGRFIDFVMVPSSRTVKKGESVELRVFGFSRDKEMPEDEELVPLVPLTELTGEELVPLTPIPPVEERLMDFRVKSWTLNGTSAPVSNSNGALTPSGFTATYKAPAQRPATNPVAVTAQLEASDKAGKKTSFYVTSSISVIDSDLFLLLKVDGVEYEYYEYGFNGAYPPNPDDYFGVNCFEENGHFSFVGTHNMGGSFSQYFALEMADASEGSHPLVCLYNDGEDDAIFQTNPASPSAYTSNFERRTWNAQSQSCNTTFECADFTVNIIRYSKESKTITGYFSGKLYEDKPEYNDNCTTPIEHTIEGEFNLMPATWWK